MKYSAHALKVKNDIFQNVMKKGLEYTLKWIKSSEYGYHYNEDENLHHYMFQHNGVEVCITIDKVNKKGYIKLM